MDLSFMDLDQDGGKGLVKLYIEGAEVGEPIQGGQVTLVVLPPEVVPVG
ncbi:MAG: hypothetical protein KAI26_05680 [Nanoarchaeota archaeon]|nr:hypothetical protein [Nanoarchaeota archaeon]